MPFHNTDEHTSSTGNGQQKNTVEISNATSAPVVTTHVGAPALGLLDVLAMLGCAWVCIEASGKFIFVMY